MSGRKKTSKQSGQQLNLFDKKEALKIDQPSLVKTFKVKITKEDTPGMKKLKNNVTSRIKAIQKLKEQLEKLPVVISKLNDQYNREIGPIMSQLQEARISSLELLDQMYQKKSMNKKQKEQIRTLILDIIQELQEAGIDMAGKYESYYQIEFSDSDDPMKGMVKDVFKMMTGLDVDIDDLIGENKLGPEELKNKYRDQFEQQDSETRDKPAQKDADFETHFQKLYKSLAKQVHPDLESDPKIKKEKEALMQQLAHAKDSGDIYQMITLKLKIENYNQQETVLDDTYIKFYADKLLEKKEALEMDLWMMKHRSGHNSWLYQFFYANHQKTINLRFNEYKSEMEGELDYYQTLLANGKTVTSFKEFLLEFIEEDDDDDFSWFIK